MDVRIKIELGEDEETYYAYAYQEDNDEPELIGINKDPHQLCLAISDYFEDYLIG